MDELVRKLRIEKSVGILTHSSPLPHFFEKCSQHPAYIYPKTYFGTLFFDNLWAFIKLIAL